MDVPCGVCRAKSSLTNGEDSKGSKTEGRYELTLRDAQEVEAETSLHCAVPYGDQPNIEPLSGACGNAKALRFESKNSVTS
jgi:hypothetical protein